MYGAVLLKAIGEPVIGAFYRIYQVKACYYFYRGHIQIGSVMIRLAGLEDFDVGGIASVI